MKAPNCTECGMQMVQQFSIGGSQTGYHWRCQVVHRRPGFGSPPDLGRSESDFSRTQRRLRKAKMRQKMKQHPLRFFVVEPLKAVGKKLADWLEDAIEPLTYFLVTLALLIVTALGLALGLGLLFFLYTILIANIIISLVVGGIVVAIVAVLALLYW